MCIYNFRDFLTLRVLTERVDVYADRLCVLWHPTLFRAHIDTQSTSPETDTNRMVISLFHRLNRFLSNTHCKLNSSFIRQSKWKTQHKDIKTEQVTNDINTSVKKGGATNRKHRRAVFLSVKLSLRSIFRRVDALLSMLLSYWTLMSANVRAACAANKLLIVFYDDLNVIIKLAVRMSAWNFKGRIVFDTRYWLYS